MLVFWAVFCPGAAQNCEKVENVQNMKKSVKNPPNAKYAKKQYIYIYMRDLEGNDINLHKMCENVKYSEIP